MSQLRSYSQDGQSQNEPPRVLVVVVQDDAGGDPPQAGDAQVV